MILVTRNLFSVLPFGLCYPEDLENKRTPRRLHFSKLSIQTAISSVANKQPVYSTLITVGVCSSSISPNLSASDAKKPTCPARLGWKRKVWTSPLRVLLSGATVAAAEKGLLVKCGRAADVSPPTLIC